MFTEQKLFYWFYIRVNIKVFLTLFFFLKSKNRLKIHNNNEKKYYYRIVIYFDYKHDFIKYIYISLINTYSFTANKLTVIQQPFLF